jgi:hypothetical protein
MDTFKNLIGKTILEIVNTSSECLFFFTDGTMLKVEPAGFSGFEEQLVYDIIELEEV